MRIRTVMSAYHYNVLFVMVMIKKIPNSHDVGTAVPVWSAHDLATTRRHHAVAMTIPQTQGLLCAVHSI